ncbi:MAG: hypothetical protein LKE43_01550 [Olsenella sp.]|nr:hypothetical protein [Olsenella sp.]
MKIVEIRPHKEGLYDIHLDNGKVVSLKIDILPELDGTLMFTAMFPTGWIMSGEAGGFYGNATHITIDPNICVNCGPLEDEYKIADGTRASGDYVAATVNAIREIWKTLGQ